MCHKKLMRAYDKNLPQVPCIPRYMQEMSRTIITRSEFYRWAPNNLGFYLSCMVVTHSRCVNSGMFFGGRLRLMIIFDCYESENQDRLIKWVGILEERNLVCTYDLTSRLLTLRNFFSIYMKSKQCYYQGHE